MMALFGFGFLMSFLRFHRWMSLGLTLFLMCIAVQIYILFGSFWHLCFNGGWANGAILDLNMLISASRAAFMLIIVLGALIGKVDAFQMMAFSFIVLIFYSLN